MALLPPAGASDREAAELPSRIDSLQSNGYFEDALVEARALRDLRSANPAEKKWTIVDATLNVSTLETITSLPSEAQMEVAQAWRLRKEIEVGLAQGKYVESISAAQKRVTVLERYLGRKNCEVGRSYFLLAELYRSKGEYAAADSLQRSAMQILKGTLGSTHPEYGMSLNSIAVISSNLARFDDAERFYRQSLVVLEAALGPEDANVAVGLNNLAELYRDRGRLEEAEPLYRRSISILEKRPEPRDVQLAAVMNNLGILYSERGLYAESRPLKEGALEILESILGSGHPYIATVMRNMAIDCRDQGAYQRAEVLSRQALQLSEANPNATKSDVARCLVGLGLTVERLGRRAEAESLYVRALDMFKESVGDNHPQVGVVLNNLSVVYREEGRFDDSKACAQRAFEIWEQKWGPRHPEMATVINNMGNLYVAMGDYDDAEVAFEQARKVLEQSIGADQPRVATSFYNSARARRHRDDPAGAVEMASRSLAISEANFSKNCFALGEGEAIAAARLIRDASDLCVSCCLDKVETGDVVARAADALLTGKGLVSDDVFERRRIWTSRSDSTSAVIIRSLQSIVRERSRMFVRGPMGSATQARADSLARLERRFETELGENNVRYRDSKDARHVNVDRVTSFLPKGSMLVEYARISYVARDFGPQPVSRYVALVVQSGNHPVIVDLGEAESIDREVTRYRAHFGKLEVKRTSNPNRRETDDYLQVVSALYEKLWEPIEQYVTDTSVVLLSPDANLNVLSFAGLWDPVARTYLVEKYAIHYLSAGRDLVRYQHKDEPGKGLLAIGMPDYGATVQARDATLDTTQVALRGQPRAACAGVASLQFAPLPGTGTEVEAIVKSWKKKSKEPVHSYAGAQASEERFKAEAPGTRVIHLATHGYYLQKNCNPTVEVRSGFEPRFVGENPLLLSGLALAGANLHGKGANMEGAEDGILTAYEVAAMDLEGTEMVVLSACETGLGTVEEGEGVYGLRRAFLMAGARTVVSALWSVPDKTTAEMMGRLYEESDKPTYESVRGLQLKRIRDLRKKNQPDHPLSWGAFIVVGDPR